MPVTPVLSCSSSSLRLESEKRKAAEFGLQLHESNEALRAELAGLKAAAAADYDALFQETFLLRQRLADTDRLQADFDSELDELKAELKQARSRYEAS